LRIFDVPEQFRRGTRNQVLLRIKEEWSLPHSIWPVITTIVVPRRAAGPRVAPRTPPRRHRRPPSFPLPLLSPILLSLCRVYYRSRRFYHTTAPPASSPRPPPAAVRRPLPLRHRCSPSRLAPGAGGNALFISARSWRPPPRTASPGRRCDTCGGSRCGRTPRRSGGRRRGATAARQSG